MASPRPQLEILTESSSYFALVMRSAAEAYTPQYWMLRALAAESSKVCDVKESHLHLRV